MTRKKWDAPSRGHAGSKNMGLISKGIRRISDERMKIMKEGTRMGWSVVNEMRQRNDKWIGFLVEQV